MKSTSLIALAACTALFISGAVHAQNVGVGTATPSEKLHVVGGARITDLSGTGNRLVQSNTTGVLSNIADGASGQILTTNGAGTYSFQALVGSSSAWELLGNAGTVSGTNFLGTTNAQSLDFRTNGILRTRITLKGQIEVFNTGLSVFVGEGAGANDDLSNNFNVFLGHQAGFTNTTGFNNSATGYNALYSNTIGLRNSASGYMALYNNIDGNYNTAMGAMALLNNIDGDYNVATGYLALRSNTTGSYNSASGYVALYYNTTGDLNTASGYRALFNNTIGNNNSATGYQALFSNTTGNDNSASGGYALFSNTIGNNNTAIGYRAGDNITVGNKNIVIGYNIDAPLAAGSNQLNIGNLIYATGMDGTGTTVSNGKVGIGINTPLAELHVSENGGGGTPTDDWLYDGGGEVAHLVTINNAHASIGLVSQTQNTIGFDAILGPADKKIMAIDYTAELAALGGDQAMISFQSYPDNIGTGTTASNNILTISHDGNVGIGTNNEDIASESVLTIGNGTIPSTSATNGVRLYAEDVAASSELKVRDEAGNISTLSPHNFSLMPNGPTEQLSWAYYSEHAPSRTAINVDMLQVVREVEKLSGKNLVHKAMTEDKKEDGSYKKIDEVEKISNSLVQQVAVQNAQIKELQKQNEELRKLLEELLDKKSE